MGRIADLPPRIAAKLTVDEHGCWLWTARCDEKGYGVAATGGRGRNGKAHRFIYKLLVGPVSDGDDLHHRPTCPKRCCNPEHLTVLSHREHGRLSRGLLSSEQLNEIRARLARGEAGAAIARAFGVSRSTISLIKRGKRWAT